MGGIGFGQGLMQGMQQAQERQFQMQYLKLQQDEAKYKQKQMETQDQLNQLNLQSLQRKIQDETTFRNQQSDLAASLTQPLNTMAAQGPSPEVEPPNVYNQVTQLMIAAEHAGQDPMKMLQMMSLQHPKLKEIYDSFQPETFTKLSEGEQLISSKTRQLVASVPPKKEKPTVVPSGSSIVEDGKVTLTVPAAPAKPPDFGDRTESAAAIYGQQHYGKAMTFSDLLATDPIQAQKIRQQTMVDEPATIAGAKTAANIQEQQRQLLTPTEANELGVPFGTTKGEAAGTMPITAHQREALASYDSARAIIRDIKQYSDKVNLASGGLRGKAEQSAKLWGAWTQSDPDAALLMSKAGELSNLARAMGEKGSLAKDDIARAAALVPGVTDTLVVAQRKIHDMMALIDEGERSFRKTLGIDARAPGASKSSSKAPIAKPPVQDPLAAIPVPKGLTPQQEQVWRESYAKQLQDMQQKMKPKGKP